MNQKQIDRSPTIYLFPPVIADIRQVLAIEKRTGRTAMFNERRQVVLVPDAEFLNLHNELAQGAPRQ